MNVSRCLELGSILPDKWLMSSSLPWERERERERELVEPDRSRAAHTEKKREDSPSLHPLSKTEHRHFFILLLSISGIYFESKGQYNCSLWWVLFYIYNSYVTCFSVSQSSVYFFFLNIFLFYYHIFLLPFPRFPCGNREQTIIGHKKKMVPVKLLILGTQNTGKTGRSSMKVTRWIWKRRK